MRKTRGRQISDYGKQLLEKQKLRYTYGLKEKQLSGYVTQALSSAQETAGELFSLLERRLDSVVYRAGLASTRRQARQMVSHGHFTHNGRRVTIPSLAVKPGDLLGVREGSVSSALFTNLPGRLKDHRPPEWLERDLGSLEVSIQALPETSLYEFDLKKIIEYYTR